MLAKSSCDLKKYVLWSEDGTLLLSVACCLLERLIPSTTSSKSGEARYLLDTKGVVGVPGFDFK